MPKYNFSWQLFDDQTIRILAKSFGFDHADGDLEDAKEWLADNCKRPNDVFVYNVFRELVKTPWLTQIPELQLRHIVEELKSKRLGPKLDPRSPDGYIRFLRKCKPDNETVRRLLCDAMIQFGQASGPSLPPGAMGASCPDFLLLFPDKTEVDKKSLHEYQKIACKALSAAFRLQKDAFKGLLVMPTGSGKTFTAVNWLIADVINQGKKVLWVAHRHELLEQAAGVFSGLAGLMAPRKQGYRLRLVSGKHARADSINYHDDILICSIAALARSPAIVDRMLTDHFLVIDEAHHAPAKSYRNLIERINARGSQQVLGLTATPTRTVIQERRDLANLLGHKPVFEMAIKRLIEQEFLAKPVLIREKTNAKVEDHITKEDIEHLERFQDLSEKWKDRIARLEFRNQQIVEHYLQNKQRYGKTLVFAINVVHAHLLLEAFREKRVKAECITYTNSLGQNDRARDRAILDRFRKSESGLDVLINVAILTEGVDLPKIQTVFLARPTQSEILLRQMVGRAMRGPRVGGTALAYLVSFEDHWEHFRELESPFPYLHDIEEAAESLPPEKLVESDPIDDLIQQLKYVASIPFEVIRNAAAELRRRHVMQPIDMFEAIPHGWFVLERNEGELQEDVDALTEIIRVYEHQRPFWEAAFEYLANADSKERSHATALTMLETFFKSCGNPRPGDYDIGLMLDHFRGGGERPVFHEIADRKKHDPHEIALRVHSQNSDLRKEIDEAYQSPLIRAIYSSHLEFYQSVQKALHLLLWPDQGDAVNHSIT